MILKKFSTFRELFYYTKNKRIQPVENSNGVCWKKLEPSTEKILTPTPKENKFPTGQVSENLRSGGAGIPFPQNPFSFPPRPRLASSKNFSISKRVWRVDLKIQKIHFHFIKKCSIIQ